ncbi:MAG: glycosyl transferase family 1 [Bacteroidales bacterium]|nr:glycosyl transferase family 1 [Bacteroidales bacterium]
MKKVLIISYYWPPSGNVGVLRNLKFVKYLRAFGWEPIVVVPQNADYAQIDPNLEKDIPEGVKVIRLPIVEPFGLFRLFTGRKQADKTNPVYVRQNNAGLLDQLSIWARGNLFIPDARFLWIKPTVKYLTKYLKDYPVDAILTDGPPHTNTVIGQQLSEKTDIPWLADFQDPWTQVDYYKMLKIGKRADRKHRRLEQATFKTAKKITIASPTWKKELEQIGASNVDVVYYGYDETDFENLTVKPSTEEFVISHAGVLGIDRQPDTFLKAIAELLDENEAFKKSLKLRFAGVVDYTIKETIASLGLNDYFEDLGFIHRKEALKLMLTSHVLLLPVNKADNAKGRLPGKIYEYLRAGNPILSLGPKGSDVEVILRNTGNGKNFEYDDYASLKTFILECFNKTFTPKSKDIESFSNYKQTQKLAGFLNAIVDVEK